MEEQIRPCSPFGVVRFSLRNESQLFWEEKIQQYIKDKYSFACVLLCIQGSSDPGGQQVGPGGTQQHGDHTAHHEPVQ